MPKLRQERYGLGRSSSFVISCINLVLQPHSEKKYIQLLNTIYNKKIDAKVRGDDALMIGSLVKFSDSDENGPIYTGELFKFLKLNAAEDWFNTLNMDSASKEDIREIVIPDHLKPHFKRFPFVFFPKLHRLYFISKKTKQSLSAGLVKRYFDIISENPYISAIGELSATVQPQEGITDEFFAINRISLIKLDIRRPNPDDHEHLHEEVLNRLDQMNAKQELIQYNEASSTGLKPDKRVRSLAQVAAENGSVYVKGRSASNEIVEVSSKDRPLRQPRVYYPSVQTELDALLEESQQLHLGLINRYAEE